MDWREAALDHYRRTSETEIVDMKINAFRAGAEWALRTMLDIVFNDPEAYSIDTAESMLEQMKDAQ